MASTIATAHMGEETKPLPDVNLDDDDELLVCMGEGGGVIPRELPFILPLPPPLLLVPTMSLMEEILEDDECPCSMVLIISKNKERSFIRSSYEPLS